MAVYNIYGVPPPPLEDHHKSINYLNKIVQGMQNQIFEMEGLAQANSLLTSSKYSMMAELVQMTATMNTMHVQLNTFSATSTSLKIPKRKFYCWICVSNLTHGRKSFASNKSVHKDNVY